MSIRARSNFALTPVDSSKSQDSRSWPEAMAHPEIYDVVLNILNELGINSVLDCPTGHGALAARLIDAGYEVTCMDLYPELCELVGVNVRRGDLDKELDLKTGSVDAVVCVEGLEHLRNPYNAITEFARVVQPSGHLIVTIPNIMNIEERLKWLLFGYTSHFKPLSREFVKEQLRDFSHAPEATLHINPIGYSELRYMLEQSGFRLVKIYKDKPKRNVWLYWPLVKLIQPLSRLASPAKRRQRWLDDLQSDELLFGGNTLIAHAQRNPS